MDYVFVPARRHYNSGKRKLHWTMEIGIKTLFYAVFMCILLQAPLSSAKPISSTTTPTPPPSFRPTPTNVTFPLGSLAVLNCSILNLGTKKVVWRKASDPNPLTIGTFAYVADRRISLNHNARRNEWNLIITDVQYHHAGEYECQVSARETYIKSFRLNVSEKKKMKVPEHGTLLDPFGEYFGEEFGDNSEIQISGLEYVEKGNPIRLVCNATGTDHPPEELDWFKDGNKLDTNIDRGVSIRKSVSVTTKTIVSTLSILKSKMEDAGNYVCRTSKRLITWKKIHVLNAETSNVKRGTFSFVTSESAKKTSSAGNGTQLSLFVVLLAGIVLNVF